MKNFRAAMMAIACVMLASCQTPPRGNYPAPAGSTISIDSMSPDGSSVLHVGDHVSLVATVSYTLTTGPGKINMMVQTENDAIITKQLLDVAAGSGTVTLKADFVVPATNAIVVYLPLFGTDQSFSTTMAKRKLLVR